MNLNNIQVYYADLAIYKIFVILQKINAFESFALISLIKDY